VNKQNASNFTERTANRKGKGTSFLTVRNIKGVDLRYDFHSPQLTGSSTHIKEKLAKQI
jgi:hypothetical protein